MQPTGGYQDVLASLFGRLSDFLYKVTDHSGKELNYKKEQNNDTLLKPAVAPAGFMYYTLTVCTVINVLNKRGFRFLK